MERLVAFREDLNVRSVTRVMTRLGAADAPDGIFVNSPGGEFEYLSVFGPALQRRGIVTLAGDVRSAAVILYLLGQRRYALPNATFFFHEVRTYSFGETVTVSDLECFLERERGLKERDEEEEIEEWLHGMRQAQAWFADFIGRRVGLRPAVFIDLMRQEVTLSAREAMQYGIVHRIVSQQEVSGAFQLVK